VNYFIDKIVKLCDSVSDKLGVLSTSVPSDMSLPLYHGPVLDRLSSVTAQEVIRVLSSSPATSSSMDIIPTSLIIR